MILSYVINVMLDGPPFPVCCSISAGRYRITSPLLLNITAIRPQGCVMKHLALSLVLIVGALPAHAACYADYKAKQDNPLRLHYGVIQVDGKCTVAAVAPQVAVRIGAGGWTLLNVVSVFGEDGLAQRKSSAGSYFLRF
jgi:hypothetical protein